MKDKLLNMKNILIFMGLIIIILLVILYYRVDVEGYLEEKGFTEYDEATYYKQLSKLTKEEFEQNVNNNVSSEYDYLYFGLGTYHLSEEIGVYDEDVKLDYIGEYDYSTGITTYNIRGEYYSTVIQLRGYYNTNNKTFTCDSLLHHDVEYDNDIKETICNLSKYHTVSLNNTAFKLIDDEKVLNTIKRKSSE